MRDAAPSTSPRPGPVWKSTFLGAFVLNHRVDLHAIDATPARWRGDLVKNCRAPGALVDFHTDRDPRLQDEAQAGPPVRVRHN